MARLATVAEAASIGRGQFRPLTLADVPTELRPSGWRRWIKGLDRTAVRTLAATGMTRQRAKTILADDARAEAYHRWLAENGLTNDRGQPLTGWDSTTLARWEEDQR